MNVVWIIDAEHWPRALLRAEMIERGLDAVGFESVDAALAAAPSRVPDAIVLETRNQALDPQRVARLFDLRVPVLLLGGAVELNEPWLRDFPWAATLQRPVSLGAIADRVAELLRYS